MSRDYLEGYRKGWLDAIKLAERAVEDARVKLVETWFDQVIAWQDEDRDREKDS